MKSNAIIQTQKYSIYELIRDYGLFDCIGVDTFSATFNANDKRTGEFVTLLFLRGLIGESDQRKNFIQLINTVNKLNHPLILPIRKAYISLDTSNEMVPFVIEDIRNISQFKLNSIIRTDFIENGQLSIHNKRYLRLKGQNNQKINPTIRSKVIFGIASLMQYLHSLKIRAFSLKYEKIYLNEKLEPLFLNIGFDYFGSVTKDVEYIPPLDDGDDLKGEVYQFAVVIYKMFSIEPLIKNKRSPDMNYVFKIKNGWRPSRPELMPDCYWELVCRCWHQNENKRPSFDEIVEILKKESFAIDEFGMKTDRNDLHEYQSRVKNKKIK